MSEGSSEPLARDRNDQGVIPAGRAPGARRFAGDSDDWALVRMVELRRAGEPARFRVCWAERAGRRHYWLVIVRGDGAIESPPRLPREGHVDESTFAEMREKGAGR